MPATKAKAAQGAHTYPWKATSVFLVQYLLTEGEKLPSSFTSVPVLVNHNMANCTENKGLNSEGKQV